MMLMMRNYNQSASHSQDEEYLAAAGTDDDDVFHSRNEEYPDEEEHHEDLNVGVLDGTRQDILNVESNMVADAKDDVDDAKLQLECEPQSRRGISSRCWYR